MPMTVTAVVVLGIVGTTSRRGAGARGAGIGRGHGYIAVGGGVALQGGFGILTGRWLAGPRLRTGAVGIVVEGEGEACCGVLEIIFLLLLLLLLLLLVMILMFWLGIRYR